MGVYFRTPLQLEKKMMYESKLAAAIKVNGKVLREFNKDTVYIPFGSEYGLLLKNLNTKRAVVNITIDGQDIVEGGLVLNAGQEVDLERFVKNGNLTEGNKLKFIERTAAIENGPRGIKLEDGLVKVEFQFEQPARPVTWINQVDTGAPWRTPGYNDYWLRNNTTTYGSVQGSANPGFDVNGALRSVDLSKGEAVRAQASASIDQYCADNGIKVNSAYHDGMATMDCAFNDAGITVPGSKSTQKFSSVYMGAMEPEKFSMVFKLLGETPDNKPVVKEVTVKTKPKCATCGRQNKHTAKFCTECGTSLEIFA